jgi:large subunit ribosomal protein L32
LGYNQRLRACEGALVLSLFNPKPRCAFCAWPEKDVCPGLQQRSFQRIQGAIMAVQQNKKSPSKRGMHRSHNALNVPGIAVEPTTGETHLRHHISPNGFYRGRQVLKNKSEA